VAPGEDDDGDGDARTQRFVICHNPEQGERDWQVRTNLVAHLTQLIDGSDGWSARRRDELVRSLKTKPGLRRYLSRTAVPTPARSWKPSRARVCIFIFSDRCPRCPHRAGPSRGRAWEGPVRDAGRTACGVRPASRPDGVTS
jgi:hypothetical protein